MAASGARALKVLVVDDDADFRWLVGTTLRSEPAITVVGEAGDGRTAIALARRERPDVVILDLKMPELGGLEATRWIKDAAPGVKVLVVTSFAEDVYRRLASVVGADRFLDKRDLATTLLPAIRDLARERLDRGVQSGR
ncbi:MAG TPA: response regulator transcription factor [Methylomirabilota bacterium]|nr:response regulator transcription factor [Methylomirabilota bacterium]